MGNICSEHGAIPYEDGVPSSQVKPVKRILATEIVNKSNQLEINDSRNGIQVQIDW